MVKQCYRFRMTKPRRGKEPIWWSVDAYDVAGTRRALKAEGFKSPESFKVGQKVPLKFGSCRGR